MRWWRRWPRANRSWPRNLRPSIAGVQSGPACTPPGWQRDPLRITFHPTGKDDASYEIVPGSAVLVEDSGDEEETPEAPPARRNSEKQGTREQGSERSRARKPGRVGRHIVSHSLRMGERRTAIGPASVALITSRDAVAGSAERLGPAMTLAPLFLHQFQSTHTMNQSAIPTGISQSANGIEFQFHGDEPSFRFLRAACRRNGSRASGSSMTPVDAHFCKRGIREL